MVARLSVNSKSSKDGFSSSMSGGMAAGDKDRQWEDLRKQARKLESEIDQKLAAFSKLGSGDSETAELLGNRQEAVNTHASHIEGLLDRLSNLNEAMDGALSGSAMGSVARMHTLARHKDILTEFAHEFRRTRSTITSSLHHSELLGPSSGLRTGAGSNFLSGESQPSGASLLRERNLIDSSTINIDNVIGQAQASLTTLQGQRDMFEGMGSKLSQLGAKYPAINNLMTAIRRKRSKDTIVLSAVIAGCTLFLLVYWLTK